MLIDLSTSSDLELLATVVTALKNTKIVERVLVVGAAARDAILHHVHGQPITRFTRDIDVAVMVETWEHFERIKERLVENGASPVPDMAHRVHLNGCDIDVVPFGGVAREGVIFWPEDEGRMIVLGFDEAMEHAIEIILPTHVSAFVAPLPAQLLLKVLAWSDRHWKDTRDAEDIRTLMDAYAADWNRDRLYDDGADLLKRFGFDNELAAAALLGRDAIGIAESRTALRVRRIVDAEVSEDSSLRLASDMSGRVEVNLQLLRALRTGFA